MHGPLPNLAGLDYRGAFYGDHVPRVTREERRALVTHYVPHAFAEYAKGDPRRGLCRICGFPGADAACATPEIRATWSTFEHMRPATPAEVAAVATRRA